MIVKVCILEEFEQGMKAAGGAIGTIYDATDVFTVPAGPFQQNTGITRKLHK